MSINRTIVDVPDNCEVPAVARDPHLIHVPLSREQKNLLDRIITGNENGTLSTEEERELTGRLTEEGLHVLICGSELNGEYYLSNDRYIEQEWLNTLEIN